MTGKERSEIKKIAQKEKAIFQVGSSELHKGNIVAIAEAFNTREIVKIKVNREDKTDKKITREIAEELQKKIFGCELIAVIGTTIILYKKMEDQEK